MQPTVTDNFAAYSCVDMGMDDGTINPCNLEFDALPFDMLSADGDELQGALSRLQSSDSVDREALEEGHHQSEPIAVAVADDTVGDDLLCELLATDEDDALACFSVDVPVADIDESTASHETGELDAVITPLSSSSSADSDQSRDSNPTRRRVKQEMDHLRERVSGLQATLSALQQSRGASVVWILYLPIMHKCSAVC